MNTSYDFGSNCLTVNTEHICNAYYGGKKPDELCFGFMLTGVAADVPQKTIFVGSRQKQWSSAMILDWYFNHYAGANMQQTEEGTLGQVYAEYWNDEPGTGKHSVIDFIRLFIGHGTITIQPVDDYVSELWEERNSINPQTATPLMKEAIDWVIDQLDKGKLRVATKKLTEVPSDLPGAIPAIKEEWHTHQWLKKAVLLSFRIKDNYLNSSILNPIEQCHWDKVPSKFAGWSSEDFQNAGFRVVPPAAVRKGAFIGRNVVLMPSFVNIGAYVGEGTMVDTWATVGSCAQIGSNCHISGGAGIGGVLEPLQANPTIIEGNVFIGARSEVCEGVIVREGAVLSMGVFIGKNTPIVDRTRKNCIIRGEVPARAVVMMGVHPVNGLTCPQIVKYRDMQTDAATALNDMLRGD